MKRDMMLVHKLIINLEQDIRTGKQAVKSEDIRMVGYLPEAVDYHLKKMAEKGLITIAGQESPFDMCVITGITWAGHDFADELKRSAAYESLREESGNFAHVGGGQS